jgi:phosphoglycerate kinase
MAREIDFGIQGMEEFDYSQKTVLLRLDINATINQKTKKIVSENRIDMSLPTVKYILDQKAKLVIIAHQGDTLDYNNLIPMKEHAQKLSEKLGSHVAYIDDVAGPAAQEAIKSLKGGEAVLLGNLRYLCEEISSFENAVKLEAHEMLETYLIRKFSAIS